jgi:DNA-binding beta-propeller fold protein YncE
VVGRPGEDGVRVKLASSGEEIIKLPLGVPDATWGRLLTVTTKRPNSLIEDLVVQPGLGGPVRSVEGAWRLPTVGLDPTPAGVSADGSTVVLVEDVPDGASPRTVSRFAIVERSLRSEPRIVELPGAFDFDTLSPDGSILYVAEHVPGPLLGRYQVRAVDTATGRMRDAVIVDKRNLDEVMAGWPLDQEARADGVVLTLYRGAEHPFIHALQSTEAWAVCIDLPNRGMDDAGASADWGVVATPDGRSNLAINATLGIVVDIHPGDLMIRRTVDFEPSARRGIILAKFGHIEAGSVGRRVVAAPDGSAVFAAGARGIVRIATDDLTVTARSLEGIAVDAVAITPDGTTVYALVHPGGRIAQLDAATGELLGWAAGEGYDRMIGVVPW